jgi:catechol 2,3-dioxygenase-like lactoylglutathione lyase family enzyme
MQVRFARHTQRLAEIVRFYHDGLGLPEIGRFEDHDGYDGVFLALPGTSAHLEFTSGGPHHAPSPHPETLLVLYLGSPEAVNETCQRAGAEPVAAANPYWRANGITLADPAGFRVVLVPRPWTSGQPEAATGSAQGPGKRTPS